MYPIERQQKEQKENQLVSQTAWVIAPQVWCRALHELLIFELPLTLRSKGELRELGKMLVTAQHILVSLSPILFSVYANSGIFS